MQDATTEFLDDDDSDNLIWKCVIIIKHIRHNKQQDSAISHEFHFAFLFGFLY